MKLDREALGHIGTSYCVTGHGRWGRLSRGRRMRKRGQRDVASGFATG